MALPLSGSSLLIKISVRPHSYLSLAAVISYNFTQIVNVKGNETEDLSLCTLKCVKYDLNMAAEILAYHVRVHYMSFLLALICYN